ncbi:MAG: hypothetical protein ABIR70_01390 [Bryobacteraceae bacterium]
MLTRLFLLLLTAVLLHAQPFTAPFFVRNAASTTGVNVAPGSLIAIQPRAAELQPMIGVTAELRVGTGAVRPLPLFTPPAGARYTWAVIPKDLPATDELIVTLIRDGVRYSATISTQRSAPGLFTANYAGTGPALAISYGGPTPARNALTSAAVPDRFVSLYATGLNDALAADVTIDVAGQTAPAVFAGPQGTPGMDQINFVVPKEAYLGCYVPVTIRVRGVASNAATLSINSDSFACAHPLGLSYADMRSLDTGVNVPSVNFYISAWRTDDQPLSERATLWPFSANASVMAALAGTQMPDSVYLSCAPPPIGYYDYISGFGPPMIATDPITLVGPNARHVVMDRSPSTVTPTDPLPFYTPGEWHLRADDGDLFFPFDQAFTLPPPISNFNIAPHSVLSSEKELEVTWNPAGFGPNDLVVVSLPSGASCTTRAWTGRVTLPKPIRSLESTVAISVIPHWAGRPQFNMLRRDGRVVRAVVNYTFIQTVNVTVE